MQGKNYKKLKKTRAIRKYQQRMKNLLDFKLFQKL